MAQWDLFITRNRKRDLHCIKACDCKASEAHLHPHGIVCIFVAHKNRNRVGDRLENR